MTTRRDELIRLACAILRAQPELPPEQIVVRAVAVQRRLDQHDPEITGTPHGVAVWPV